MGEEDGVTLTLRVNADVVLRVGRVGKERLEDEVVECARDGLDLEIHASNQQLSWYGEYACNRRKYTSGALPTAHLDKYRADNCLKHLPSRYKWRQGR